MLALRLVPLLLTLSLNATLLYAPSRTLAQDAPDTQLVMIDNGQIAVGLKRDSGGAIAWVSAGKSARNLVNSHDRGRLIQQSYYGIDDGSLWNKKPWRWNPVQGGDWRGSSAQLLELRSDATTAYAKTLPKHWASGEDLKECVMEQWITLDGPLARVHYRFDHKGERDHPRVEQELPAVFVDPHLHNLVVYQGDKPWTGDQLHRSQPGWPNERRKMTEHWAAYVDDQDQGLGVYVPVADELTCYRFGKNENAPGACAYFAPVKRMAITKDFQWEYDVVITTGSLAEIRDRFKTLADAVQKRAPEKGDGKQ